LSHILNVYFNIVISVDYRLCLVKLFLTDYVGGGRSVKAILKRLGAAIMAAAMVASLTPVTGAAVFADETETDVLLSKIKG
jgi:hypothetical protein